MARRCLYTYLDQIYRQVYGPNGLTSVLDSALYQATGTLPITCLRDLVDGSRGVTRLYPGHYDIHGGLNAWHVNDTKASTCVDTLREEDGTAGWPIPFD